MRGEVDPHVFYFLVRPWWVGNTKKTWVFEGVSSNTDKLLLDGPSAGVHFVVHLLASGTDTNRRSEYFNARFRCLLGYRSQESWSRLYESDEAIYARQAQGLSWSHCLYPSVATFVSTASGRCQRELRESELHRI